MVTVGLCFMVALMEGLDLQAAGIAAVGMAQAFALDKMQMGWIFSAGILGLLPGALAGGMLADRYGRQRILLGSVLLFGLFSIATALAWNYPMLLLARLLTGVGLGAALPNLIALTSEAAGPRFRGRAVSLMYCGVPIGAALAAALGFFASRRPGKRCSGSAVSFRCCWYRYCSAGYRNRRSSSAVRQACRCVRSSRRAMLLPLCCCGCAISSRCWWSIC
jgi:MFS family permease